MYRRPESVLVLIYTRQSKVLLLHRVDTPGFWQSVTGGLEVDEQPSVAALRELYEETGIRATLSNPLDKKTGAANGTNDVALIDHQCSSVFEIKGVWRERYHPDVTHNREHLFSIQLDEPIDVSLNTMEHRESVWFSAEQAMERASSATNKRAIEDIALTAQYRR